MDALDTQEGALLLDVAELDDLSSVLFLSLLVAMAPTLGLGLAPGIGAVARQSGGVLAKLALFLTACTVFSRFIERPITAWAERLNRRRGPALVAAGMGLAIAGAGELLGLSLAIGALFAGLAFSRDPAEKQIDRSVEELDALFTPFFFIGVGLSVSPFALSHHLGFTSALLGAAILGKVLGGGGPALAVTTPGKAALIGASLTPRAEIALIVAGYGLALGGWAMPQGLHDALVVVSLATVLSAPVAIRSMLVRMNADLIRERRLA